MKKVIAIVLLVLLTVGLFISCNGDAIATMFGGDCYYGVYMGGVHFVIFEDSHSEWKIAIGMPGEGDDIEGAAVDATKSGNTLSANLISDLEFSFATKKLRIFLTTTDGTFDEFIELKPARIITPYNENPVDNNSILLCFECEGIVHNLYPPRFN